MSPRPQEAVHILRQTRCSYVNASHLISKRSHVLVPSPQGDFLVVMCRTLVGMRTGPFTFRLLSFAPLIKSAQTAPRLHQQVSKDVKQHNRDHWDHFSGRMSDSRTMRWTRLTLLKVLHVPGGQCDTNAVDLCHILLLSWLSYCLESRHLHRKRTFVGPCRPSQVHCCSDDSNILQHS